MNWQYIDISYYDDQDLLILQAVRPLFQRLRPWTPVAYHTRHWLRGPHVRIRIRTDDDTLARVVRPAVETVVGDFLSARPSERQLDPAAGLATHQRLAELEGEPGPLLPWHPDNSIRFDTGREPEVAKQDNELLADFYVASTDLAFRMTQRARDGGQRAGMAFDLMVATAHVGCVGGFDAGFISFRSHAEAFLNGFAEAQGRRPVWDRHLTAHAGSLAERVEAVLATVEGERNSVPFVGSWVRLLDEFRPRAERFVADGGFDAGTASSPGPVERDLAGVSPFHDALYGSDAWPEVRDSDWFAVYRVLLNFTYLHLTRIGVQPLERFLLCHLAAGAAERRHGVSALDLVRGLAGSPEAVR